MLFKMDENLHPETAELLRQEGHDALTVGDQGLRGHEDKEISTVCTREKRAIVTLDLDFSDVREFPPAEYSGIIVLRLHNLSRKAVSAALRRILLLLKNEPLTGNLWIVDESQVRIRDGNQDTG